MLQACLNGGRPGDAHPSIPITPYQLARDARAVAELGIRSVHVHPRCGQGRETLDAHHVADVIAAIHASAPAMHITVPVAGWVHPDPRRRVETVTAWARFGPATPDTVTVNVSEPGRWQTCTAAHIHGIGVELGIWTAADAVHLRRTGVPPGVVRVIAEVTIAHPTIALAETDRILEALGTVGVPVGLHGQDAAAWPIWRYATLTGLHTRIGLEDTLTRPDGSPGSGNPDLIHHALRITPLLRNPPRERPHTTPPRPTRDPPYHDLPRAAGVNGPVTAPRSPHPAWLRPRRRRSGAAEHCGVGRRPYPHPT